MNKEDELYLKYVETGDNEDALYQALYRRAMKIVKLVTRSYEPELARDIVTAAFLKRDSFSGKAAFSTWFHRLARNHCIDWLRAQNVQRATLVPLEDVYEEPVPEPEEPLMLDPSEALAYLRDGLIEDELFVLEAKQRKLPDAEIAKALGLSTNGAKTRWFRLREKLRQKLSLMPPKTVTDTSGSSVRT